MLPNSYNAVYKAVVSSNADPTGMGRIRVQCPQISSLAELQWTYPINPIEPIPLVGSIVWVAFNGGDLTKPIYISNNSFIALTSDGVSLAITTLSNTSSNDAVKLFMVPGTDGSTIGGTSTPHITVRDVNTTTPVDFHMSGAMFKVNPDGSFINWQTPSYSTNWQGTTGGVSPALKFRLDMEDNLVVIGSVNSTAAFSGGTNTFGTIPAAFRPNNNWGVPCLHTNSGNTNIESCQFRVSATGNLQFASAAVTSGDRFIISATIPLGNLS